MSEKERILAALHDAVAARLLEAMQGDEPSPPMIQAAIRFLADNKIEALPTAGSNLGKLADAAPFKMRDTA